MLAHLKSWSFAREDKKYFREKSKRTLCIKKLQHFSNLVMLTDSRSWKGPYLSLSHTLPYGKTWTRLSTISILPIIREVVNKDGTDSTLFLNISVIQSFFNPPPPRAPCLKFLSVSLYKVILAEYTAKLLTTSLRTKSATFCTTPKRFVKNIQTRI